MNKQEGSSKVLMIFVLLLLIGGAVFAYYYFVMMPKTSTPLYQTPNYNETYTPGPSSESDSTTSVSSSEDDKTIEQELNSTNEGNTETDINSLNSNASSL